ncbi:MAG: altronate dehydratase [Fusobacteriaceae bacterium]|nr:altronate dehydratase [Fusobacteriaceae bacterium]MBN2838903.1 altronate dehydratase [Fusobacteriaceae bacterium]
MKDFIKINPKDNVIVALKDLPINHIINLEEISIELKNDVNQGHKIAIKEIKKNENIIKYGVSIGHALEDIKIGEHVHTHNIKTNLKDLLNYSYDKKIEDFKVSLPNKNVNVYQRKNGDVGIRNELWIVPTVGCVNGIGEQIKERFEKEYDISNIDGVFMFPHNYGCSQLGDDHETTKIILQNMVKHPNAGGVLILGLGCENNQIGPFMDTLGNYDENRVKTLITQDVEDEVEEGLKLLKELYSTMKNDKRVEAPISSLKIGLECGGSDSFSGITANPLLGELSNYLINYGGTTVLTEVPEMFGAETFLMERAKDKETFDKVVCLINDFKEYFIKHNQEIYENPSPGNKKGGITTLEEKSLGAVEKSGKSEVIDVLKYGEIIKKNGLNLLSAPGNDLVATTALAASGCHMVIFTTGRGTPFGGFVPTIKVSTNSNIFNKKKNWMDFNAGALVEDKTMDEVLESLIDLVVEVSNGKQSKNEINKFRNLAIFKSGVTL